MRRGEPYIAVIGSGGAVPDEVLAAAEEIGRRIAEAGAVLVCGGLGGVMEAAARGAAAAGGTTVGILPGLRREEANPFVRIALPTGLGEVRNVLVVRAADAVVMVHGEVGTLSEAVLAYQHGVPVVALATSGGWAERIREAALDGAYLDARRLVRIDSAATPAEAVALALRRAEARRR